MAAPQTVHLAAAAIRSQEHTLPRMPDASRGGVVSARPSLQNTYSFADAGCLLLL